jgi:hypothetical protein
MAEEVAAVVDEEKVELVATVATVEAVYLL